MRKIQLLCCSLFLFILSSCSQSEQNEKSALDESGAILPFPVIPSPSIAGPTLAESKLAPWPNIQHLPKNAPNILIILLDDTGFGLPDTFGGEVHTPTLTRVNKEGIAYNEFHTTAICSPTRACLLTGRNHTRVGSGTIAERAVDFDGYTGIIPKTAAMIPEILKDYGYSTAAFGKWHNTPANQTTTMGPFDYWPTSYGFEYFYGFLGGETSQWEPRLFENTRPIEPPKNDKYHLSSDLADKAVEWLQEHQAFAPDKPFFVYWAPGAGHGPHHIFKEWADNYKGKFDDGWDLYRERVYKRQKELGWIPADSILTPRADTMASWDSIPENERPFQRRLMEVFAGFVEHVDTQVGKIIDALDEMGVKDNTLIFYIWGDNGSSAEGQNGTISELLAQNQIPNTIAQQIEVLNEIGGLDVLGSPDVDNMYHAAWGWAGNTPFKYTKLIASFFGGTRNPLVISWPKSIKADSKVRRQFHHVIDVAPTIYEILGIPLPKVVNGYKQMSMDGVSMKYTFTEPDAPSTRTTQFFDNNGSRALYHEGWMASTFGPLIPWLTVSPGLKTWDPNKDVWELYDIRTDYTQAIDLAAKDPARLEKMKEMFLEEAKKNDDFPIGGGIWTRLHPEDALSSPYKSWVFKTNISRMPEFAAPGLGKKSNKVVLDIETTGEDASGVLYALGGASGGLTFFMEDGKLVYEYNMMIIERYTVESKEKLAPGRHKVEVITQLTSPKPMSPATITIKVDGKEVATGIVKRTVPGAFTATETLDVGKDLGSPVSRRYKDKAPFPFNGKIYEMKIDLL